MQAQFKQERQDWLEQKGDIESGHLRLEEETHAKFLELEGKITARLEDELAGFSLWCQKKEEEAKTREEKTRAEEAAHNLQMEEQAKARFEEMKAEHRANIFSFLLRKDSDNKVENKAWFDKMEAEYTTRLQRLEEENQALNHWKRMEEGRRQKSDAEREYWRKAVIRQEENTLRHLRQFEKIDAENWRLDAENQDLKEELRVLKDQLLDINSRVGELEDTLEMVEEWEDVDSETETLVPEESEVTAEKTEKVLPIKAIDYCISAAVFVELP